MELNHMGVLLRKERLTVEGSFPHLDKTHKYERRWCVSYSLCRLSNLLQTNSRFQNVPESICAVLSGFNTLCKSSL
jgi:hypothetical protein